MASSTTVEMGQTSAMSPIQTMRGHTDWVQGAVHLPGGRRIITGSNDGSLRLWDLKSGVQIGDDWRDEEDKAGVITIALSPKGDTVTSGSGDGMVRLWDVEMGKVIAKWTGHAVNVNVWSVSWSPDGERLVSGSWDGTARVWNIKSGQTVLGLTQTGHQYVLAMIFSPDATKIATGGFNEHAVKIWDARTGKLLSTVQYDHPVWSLAWTSDGKKLVFGSYHGPIEILDAGTLQQIATLEGHQDTIRAIDLFSNDRLLASASWDKTARLWNLDTGLPISVLDHRRDVNSVAFSADGKQLVTCCDDQNAYVWDIHAVLKKVGAEDLLSTSDQDAAGTPSLNADATRRSAQIKGANRIPQGFFDDARDHVNPSATYRRHPFTNRTPDVAPSLGLRARAFFGRTSSFFHRSHPGSHDAIEFQQHPRQGSLSWHRPHVVEVVVAAAQNKIPLYVAPPPNKKSTTQGAHTPEQNQAQSQSQALSSHHQAAQAVPAAATTTTPTSATDTPSHTATTIDNPRWWIRIMLFICCTAVNYTDARH